MQLYISEWDNRLNDLLNIVAKPVYFNDLKITLLDAIAAPHPANWIVPSHQHPWFEFNYVSQGAVYTTIEGREFVVKSGEFFLVPPGRMHSHRNYESIGDDGFCLRWKMERTGSSIVNENSTGVAESIISNLSEPRPFAMVIDMQELMHAIRNKSELQIQMEFLKWVVCLNDLMNEADTAQSSINNRETIITRQVLLYLLEYYDREIKVEEISDALNISYRHIARIFRRVTGKTIIEKLNEIRIEEARKLLVNSDIPVRTVAYQIGFKNEFYFTSIFKRYTGLTPSQYRMKNRSCCNYDLTPGCFRG